MKARAPAKYWTEILSAPRRLASAEEKMPILESVLAFAREGPEEIEVMATDTEVAVTQRAQGGVSVEREGRAAIPCGPLRDTAKMLAGEDRELEVEVREGEPEVVLRSEGSFEGEFAAYPAADYPAPPDPSGGDGGEEAPEAMTWQADALRSILQSVSFAAAGDEAMKPALNGTYFNLPASDVVATDGHRYCRLALPGDQPWDGILPTEAGRHLLRALPETGAVRATASRGAVRFEWPGGSVSTKLIDQEYPDYESVLPSGHSVEVAVGRESLIQTLTRVGAYAGEDGAVRLVVPGARASPAGTPAPQHLTVSAQDPSHMAEAEESVPAEVREAPTSGPFEIGVRASYLQQCLESFPSEKALLRFVDPHTGIRVLPLEGGEVDGGHLTLVMPILLKKTAA